MSARPFPRLEVPGTLGAGLGVSTEWVLALWLTLMEGRSGAREQRFTVARVQGGGLGLRFSSCLARACLRP